MAAAAATGVDSDARVPMRERIIDTAVQLFAERGFAGTSIRDITRPLGISNPALYHHFSSKDELLRQIVVRPAQLMSGALDRAESRPVEQRAAVVLAGFVEAIAEHGRSLLPMFADPSVLHVAACEQVMTPIRDRMVTVLAAAEPATGGPPSPHGALAPRVRAEMAVGALQNGIVEVVRASSPNTSPDEFKATLLDSRDDLVTLALRLLADG